MCRIPGDIASSVYLSDIGKISIRSFVKTTSDLVPE